MDCNPTICKKKQNEVIQVEGEIYGDCVEFKYKFYTIFLIS